MYEKQQYLHSVSNECMVLLYMFVEILCNFLNSEYHGLQLCADIQLCKMGKN